MHQKCHSFRLNKNKLLMGDEDILQIYASCSTAVRIRQLCDCNTRQVLRFHCWDIVCKVYVADALTFFIPNEDNRRQLGSCA